MEADEFDLGRCNPSKFSRGGSSLAILLCLSDVRDEEKEVFTLGALRELLSESVSESESSQRLGYRHFKSALVGLKSSITRVSALALPSLSIVSTTEVRDRASCLFGVSAMGANATLGSRLLRLVGDGLRAIPAAELLRVNESSEAYMLCGRATPVVLLLRTPGRKTGIWFWSLLLSRDESD